ncbi:MAG: hypothetical protein JWQ53_443 [Klenkia sp.]|nr:hypothetical protein [Klenkia sp.]
MRFTSPSRRALGLLAASTIGMSTAVLGVTGVASAAPVPTLIPGQTLTSAEVSGFTVAAGVCAIDWSVYGAPGGRGSATAGAPGGVVTATVDTAAGETFQLYAGGTGGDATPTAGGTGGSGHPDGDVDFSGEVGGESVDGGVYSGGGGGGSLAVSAEAGPVVGAFGGDGGDFADTGLGQGGGYNFALGQNPVERVSDGGAGSISATGIACAAPSAPESLQAVGGDGSAAVSFFAPATDFGDATITGYEVQVDGGAWTPLSTVPNPGTDREEGTVALANGPSAHTVAVRATSAVGPGESASVSDVYAASTTDAPTDVVVTPGVSSIRVTWKAPADTTGISGYEAYAVTEGAQSSGEGAMCTVDAQTFTCFLAVPAGVRYFVGVSSLNEAGFGSEGSVNPAGLTPVIAAPAIPSAVPTEDDGDIAGPAGPITSVTAGQKLTLQGAGFAPNSTVQLTLFSAPVSLGTVVTDENGSFSVEVTLPANLTNGTHTLVATGINPDGTTRNLVITVTVSGGVVTDAATLANTGFDTAVPLTGGALALLAGAGMLVGARRRSSN